MYYASLALALGIAYQFYYNYSCMKDMGGDYNSTLNGVYYLGTLVPGLMLAIYSMRLASSRIALKKTSNNSSQEFQQLWKNGANTYTTIAKVYVGFALGGLLPYVYIIIRHPMQISTQKFSLYCYYFIAFLQLGLCITISAMVLYYNSQLKKKNATCQDNTY